MSSSADLLPVKLGDLEDKLFLKFDCCKPLVMVVRENGSITLIPNPDKNITRKENYKPVSLMNDSKILQKKKEKLSNQIQQYIKRITQMTK